MIIKKTSEYIPICFLNPILNGKKVINYTEGFKYESMWRTVHNVTEYNYIETAINPDLNNCNCRSIGISRSNGFKTFYGILLNRYSDGIPLIIPCINAKSRRKIFKNIPYKDLVIFINQTYLNNNRTVLNRWIKQLVKLGVNQKNIQFLSQDDLIMKFCSVYTPTMLDYEETIQKNISSKFILKMREQLANRVSIEVPSIIEKYSYTDFNIGDIVVIVNNKHSGDFEIGELGIINDFDGNWYKVENSRDNWMYKGDGDIRHATQEEIDSYNNTHVPETITQGNVQEVVEAVEEEILPF
jgi:hypothetical protein